MDSLERFVQEYRKSIDSCKPDQAFSSSLLTSLLTRLQQTERSRQMQEQMQEQTDAGSLSKIRKL